MLNTFFQRPGTPNKTQKELCCCRSVAQYCSAFHRQTTLNTHDVSVFATFPPANCNVLKTICLFMSLLEDNTMKTAHHIIVFPIFLFELSDKRFEHVTALIAESCTANRRFATKCSNPLIGCSSHYFNLPFVGSYLRTKTSSHERNCI